MKMLTLLLENQITITTYFDVADTSIKSAGPEGNPFYDIYWLAKEYEEHQIIQNHPNTAQSPTSRLWYYLSNYHQACTHASTPTYILSNLSTPGTHFPVLLSTVVRSQFRSSLQPS